MDGKMTTPVVDIAIGHKFIRLTSGSSLMALDLWPFIVCWPLLISLNWAMR